VSYGNANVKTNIKDVTKLIAGFGMVDRDASRVHGAADFFDEFRLASGINPIKLVNDMETVGDFVETDSGTFDIAVNSSNKVIGTNSQKFTATAQGDGTQYITTAVLNAGSAIQSTPSPSDRVGMDWTQFDFIGMWVRPDSAGDFGTSGDLKINVANKSVWQTAIATPVAPLTAVFGYWEIDLTSFTRDQVTSIRFELQSGPGAGEDISIDQMRVYKFGTGNGPLMGRCIPLPVKSGVTLTRGQIAEFEEATHRIDVEAAASPLSIGPVVVGGTAGNASGSVFAWVQDEGLAYMVAGTTIAAGDPLMWGAAHQLMIIAGTSTPDQRGFAKALTAGAEDAVILVKLGFGAPHLADGLVS